MHRCCFLSESARTAAKSRTNLSTNSRKATKTAGQIGTKFGTHVQIHIGIDIRQIAPRDTRGHLGVLEGQQFKSLGYGVTNSKVWGSYQTAGPIGTKFGTYPQIHLGMDIHQTNCSSRHKGGGHLGGRSGVKHSKVWGSCQTAGPIGTNFSSRLRIRIEMDIG